MILRPYQVRAVAEVRAEYARGRRAVVLVLPTGAGKTIVAAYACREHVARGGRVVFLTHTRELRRQTVERFRACGLDVGYLDVTGDHRTEAPVLVATLQTVLARGERVACSLVVVDECHHLGDGAAEWQSVLELFGDARRLGLTATPQRGDGTALSGFDALVVGVTIGELQSLGQLVPCDVWAPKSRESRIVDPVRTMAKHARGRRCIVYAQHTEHARELVEQLRADGWRAARADSTLTQEDFAAVLEQFRHGMLDALVNVFCLTEGFDVPAVDCVVIARGCSSQAAWLQMIGRGLRPSPGKFRCLVLDCKGSVHLHGLPDAPRSYTLEGRGITLRDAAPSLRQCRTCGAWGVGLSVCGRCGSTFPPPPRPKVRVADLQHVRAVESDDTKRAWWRGKLVEARARGRKAGWAAHLFRAVYGHDVPRAWWGDLTGAASNGS